MSLRSKIILILSAVVVAYASVDNWISRRLVSSGFVRLEESEAAIDLDRAVGAIGAELAEVERVSSAHANSPTLVRFVQGLLPEFERDMLDSGFLDREDLDLCFVLDAEHNVLWSQIVDAESRENVSVREFPPESLDRYHPLLDSRVPRGDNPDRQTEELRREAGWIAGLMRTDRGIVLAGASPVLLEDGERVGSVIVGRFLGDRRMSALGKRLSLQLAAWPLDGSAPIQQGLLDEITAAGDVVIHPIDGDRLEAFVTMVDVRKLPELVLRAEIDRRITKSGYEVTRYAAFTAIGAALFILAALLMLLQRMVLIPLGNLTSHAVRIGQTDDTSRKLDLQRADEFGQLGREFDRMIEKLAESRAAHADTARMVGMSEIATGVLHNVGNVLNSVNVSASLVRSKIEKVQLRDIEMMLGVLEEHSDDLGRFVSEDPRGKHLLPFLTQLVEALRSQRQEALAETEVLGEGIEHIMELVRSQQSYAGLSGLYETRPIQRELDAAVKISERAQPGVDDVEFIRSYDDVPPFPIDTRKVTEIFVNLIQNARHAMEATEGPKRIELGVRQIDGGRVRVSVRDHGGGIEQQNLARIFNHGFTTKRDGHGFGLHSCANAATEMKGSLYALSDGPGTGAEFVLELPLDPEAARIAA